MDATSDEQGMRRAVQFVVMPLPSMPHKEKLAIEYWSTPIAPTNTSLTNGLST